MLHTSEDIVPQFLRMMTALTDTSSPELPHSLNALDLWIPDWLEKSSNSLKKRDLQQIIWIDFDDSLKIYGS